MLNQIEIILDTVFIHDREGVENHTEIYCIIICGSQKPGFRDGEIPGFFDSSSSIITQILDNYECQR
jgi:hypothetical protein